MIAGAAMLFFVFATIGAYREVLKAEKKYKELEKIVNYEYERGYGDGFRDGVKDEAKHGEWVYQSGDYFTCTNCGGDMVRNVFPFCPWCGADMRERKETE